MKISPSKILIFLSLIALIGCQGVSEIVITPQQERVVKGLELQLKVEKVFTNGKVVDITNSKTVKWQSSNESIAIISNKGLLSSVSAGEVKISATGTFDGKVFNATTMIHVIEPTVKSITVTPQGGTAAIGLTKSFTAMAHLSNGLIVDVTNDNSTKWTVNDTDIAEVSNQKDSKGVAEAKSTGSTSITAHSYFAGNRFSDSATFNINDALAILLDVSPPQKTIIIGLEGQLSAVLQLDNGDILDITNNRSISWSSSNPETATISNDMGSKGRVTGVNPGSVEIFASVLVNGQNVYGKANFEVLESKITSLEIQPKHQTVAVGLKNQLKVFAHQSNGKIIDVTKDSAISWSSSHTGLATISNSLLDKGVANGLKVGNVTITAFVESDTYNITDTATLNISDAVIVDLDVTPKPQLNLNTPQIPSNSKKQFNAEVIMSDHERYNVTKDARLTWQSQDESIATVSNTLKNKGVATGKSTGITSISAKFHANDSDFDDIVELTVTPPHLIKLSVSSGLYRLKSGEYIGYYKDVMGSHFVTKGSEYLSTYIKAAYALKVFSSEGSESEVAFIFGQSTHQPISGSLRYSAEFKWSDSTVTKGVLEWDFENAYYKLTDNQAIEKLLQDQLDFELTVSNLMLTPLTLQ